MALDSLQKIKSLEEETEGMIRAARQQMAREVEEAKKKQKDEYTETEKRCREDLRKALAGVEEEANNLHEEQDKVWCTAATCNQSNYMKYLSRNLIESNFGLKMESTM